MADFEREKADVLDALETASAELLARLLVARQYIDGRAREGDAAAIGIADQLGAAWASYEAVNQRGVEFMARWERDGSTA